MIKKLLKWAGAFALRAAGVTNDEILKLFESDGAKSSAGVPITEASAYANSAFYSGVTFLSETIASLPAAVYQFAGEDARKRDRAHPVAKILRRRANKRMSAMTVIETMQANCFGWGHGYAEIEWSEEPRPLALWPIHPSYVTPLKTEDAYEIKVPGETQSRYLPGWRMLHLRAPQCYGLIDKAKESIGISAATEKFTGLFFGHNATLGTILERDADCKLTDKQADELKSSLNNKHGGLANSHRTALLPNGVKAKMLALAPELAQLIETRRFQVEEIARFLRMPVHLLRETSHGVSYASIEIQSTEFLLYTLRPWLCRWEDELTYKLLLPSELDTHFIEFNAAALLRADLMTRYQAYNLGRNGGWLSRNDIRKLENMSPIDGGDDYLTPKNMDTVATTRKAKRLAKVMKALLELEKGKKKAA